MRPLEWIDQASPQEIGEALLASDPVKAAAVTAYLLERSGPELGQLAERVEQEVQSDPVGSLGRFLTGVSQITKK